MVPSIGLVQVGVAHLNGETASLRHRIASVDGQVHDDLLDVAGVGLDHPRLGIGHDGPVDVLTDDAAKHLVHVGHHGPQIENFRLQKGLAAEGQELSRVRLAARLPAVVISLSSSRVGSLAGSRACSISP